MLVSRFLLTVYSEVIIIDWNHSALTGLNFYDCVINADQNHDALTN